MSWIYREPPEPAIFGQRRRFAPPVVRRAFSRARAAQALDVFLEDPWPLQRRAFAPLQGIRDTAASPFGPAWRVLASLLGAGVYDDPPHPSTPRRPAPTPPAPGDNGRSASFTVTFTGKGDDPYGPVGLTAGPGVALGADTQRELAVQNLATFGGSSASRTV